MQLQQLEQKAGRIMNAYFLKKVKHGMAQEISFGNNNCSILPLDVANGAELLLLDEPVADISPP